MVPSGQYGLATVWYRMGRPDAVTPSQNEVAVAVPDGRAVGEGDGCAAGPVAAACAAWAVPADRAAQHAIAANV
ncbi:hypothetical protein GCM10023194_17800 [Planotetraspora phitsanulokensis]|uniref:Uncharacterized protein n=1 Tax=Planotetraspora phitsanulokensis TaxID=575192 RepID=A0A8J3TYX3_9ACTN|nr:hypothetical protein Pph01_01440 [Planotetraspora phitsanulokensis]